MLMMRARSGYAEIRARAAEAHDPSQPLTGLRARAADAHDAC